MQEFLSEDLFRQGIPNAEIMEQYPFCAINADGMITSWNKASEHMFAIKSSRALGSFISELLYGGHAGQCPSLRLVKMDGEQAVFYADFNKIGHGKIQLSMFCFAWRVVGGAAQCMLPIMPLTGDGAAASYDDYREIVDKIGDGFVLNQDNKLLLVNSEMARLLDYDSPLEMVNRPATDFIAETHREAFLLAHDKKIAGLAATHTWPHLKKNGEIVWLEGHPKRIIWKGHPAMISTLINVTRAREREMRIKKEAEQLREENARLRHSLVKSSWRFQNIVGKSAPMRNVYEMLMKASKDESSVIIYGETGTGKELAARAIHSLSERSAAPFVAVNCGAIPAELLESEFFGVKKGAFTGAHADRKGYLDQADGGFLFLDEVGELPLPMQVKLLRALETHSFRAVGSAMTHGVNIRVIAATNRNLLEDVSSGLFREDLFYRLHVIPITLPPLRERKEDIPLLLEFILNKCGYEDLKISNEFLERLLAYDWPGNVREFNNTIQRWLALGTLDLIHSPFSEGNPVCDEARPLAEAMASHEAILIADALRKTGGNRSKAARLLGISRRCLYRKLDKTGAKNILSQ